MSKKLFIVLFILILMIIENNITINKIQTKIIDLDREISTLQYENIELRKRIEKIKFRSVIWGAE
jgi:cell division protein FtsL